MNLPGSAPGRSAESVDREAAHGRHPGAGPSVEQRAEDLGDGNGAIQEESLATEPPPQAIHPDLVAHQETVKTIHPVVDGPGGRRGRPFGPPLGRASVPGEERQAGLHTASVSASAGPLATRERGGRITRPTRGNSDCHTLLSRWSHE